MIQRKKGKHDQEPKKKKNRMGLLINEIIVILMRNYIYSHIDLPNFIVLKQNNEKFTLKSETNFFNSTRSSIGKIAHFPIN